MSRHRRALFGFFSLGVFWGSWSALIPSIKTAMHLGFGTLAISLAMVAVGIAVAMRVTKPFFQRFGTGTVPLAGGALAACGVLPGLATDAGGLISSLVLVGFTMGAFWVGLDTLGDQTRTVRRDVLMLRYLSLSAGIVAGSLLTGVASSYGYTAAAVLMTVAVLLIVTSAFLFQRPTGTPGDNLLPVEACDAQPVSSPPATAPPVRRLPAGIVGTLGALIALAYVAELTWYGWSALHLASNFSLSPIGEAAGPAVFAAALAAGRAGASAMTAGRIVGSRWRVSDEILVAAGAVLGACGTAVTAMTTTPLWAFMGLAISGFGMSVCAPTLLALTVRWSSPRERGTTLSRVTTIARLGFVLSPLVVGGIAVLADLRLALVAIAAIAAALAALAVLLKVVREAATVPPAPSRQLGAALIDCEAVPARPRSNPYS